MKRAEQLAWAALVGLLVIAIILLTGGIMYKFTGFWAGAMLAAGQALVVGLAAWGLMLARQAADLDGPIIPSSGNDSGAAESGGFRMSMADDSNRTSSLANELNEKGNTKILDTGFQRMVVGIAGIVLVSLAGVGALLVYMAYHWGQLHPDQALPVAGTYDKPLWLDELGLVMGLAAAGIYGVLYWITKPKRNADAWGDAVSSNFTLGIAGMGALAAASVLGYLRVSYASELAAGMLSFLMGLQGLELLVNAFRSYSSIEELDQEAIDLQATPLVPMLGSVWLSGLRMLFAQSVGLSGQERREKGVFARMMPRALAAIVIIAIGVSCIRVVKPGEVAVLERLGYAPTDKDNKLLPEALLHPGMHLTLPWPIDQLVTIPTEELQLTEVGTELHAPKEWQNVDFQFWTIRGGNEADESNDLFITGDTPSQQLLETFIQVRWRVAQPDKFYSALSHSDFYEKEENQTKALPIYAAIVQQATSFAVSRTFAIHSLQQIMIDDRAEVEKHCREILQKKLDEMGSGIAVEFLTIKDLHPPYWHADQDNAAADMIGGIQKDRGPASAFEFVVSMREIKETIINLSTAEQAANLNAAKGFAASEVAKAQQYKSEHIALARGDADRLVKMTEGMDPKDQEFLLNLLEGQLLYSSMKDLFDQVPKYIHDPNQEVQLYQVPTDRVVPPRPPGT